MSRFTMSEIMNFTCVLSSFFNRDFNCPTNFIICQNIPVLRIKGISIYSSTSYILKIIIKFLFILPET